MKATTVFCAMLFAGAMWAQSYLGAVRGTVIDSSGKVIGEVKVTLLDEAGGGQRATISTAEGFSFSQVVPATYSVVAEAPGIQALRAQTRHRGDPGDRVARSQNGNRLGQRKRAGHRGGAADRYLHRLAGPGAGSPATRRPAQPRAQSLHDVQARAERHAGGRSALQPHAGPERLLADLHRRRPGARQQLSARRHSDHRRRQSRHDHSHARSRGRGQGAEPTPTMRRWRAPAAACSTPISSRAPTNVHGSLFGTMRQTTWAANNFFNNAAGIALARAAQPHLRRQLRRPGAHPARLQRQEQDLLLAGVGRLSGHAVQHLAVLHAHRARAPRRFLAE